MSVEDLVNKPIETLDVETAVKASRFIPFYYGTHSTDKQSNQIECEATAKKLSYNFEHFTSMHSIKCYIFNDGFAVIVLREFREFPSILEMLLARRDTHLDIQKNKFLILKGIQNETQHPLLKGDLPGIDYVMSVHQLFNASQHSDMNIHIMAEPSLIGVTDDPQQKPLVDSNLNPDLSKIYINQTATVKVSTRGNCFYVSWSNIILTDCDMNSNDYMRLEFMQITLQKLWFQMNCYDNYLNQCIFNSNGYNLDNVVKEINRAKILVSDFCKVDSLSAGYINRLKNALIVTSHIKEISKNVGEKLNMISSTNTFSRTES